MKTKEKRENLNKMMNAWLRNCRSIEVFLPSWKGKWRIQRERERETERDRDGDRDRDRDRDKETERQENSWWTTEPFLIVFL